MFYPSLDSSGISVGVNTCTYLIGYDATIRMSILVKIPYRYKSLGFENRARCSQ